MWTSILSFLAHHHPHRLLIVLSFQSRLQTITQTIVAATPELIHVLLILVVVTVMMAVQVRRRSHQSSCVDHLGSRREPSVMCR